MKILLLLKALSSKHLFKIFLRSRHCEPKAKQSSLKLIFCYENNFFMLDKDQNGLLRSQKRSLLLLKNQIRLQNKNTCPCILIESFKAANFSLCSTIAEETPLARQ
jgi:tRNA isopentenyl-2-thiomethyl-A-37 hydroxylase MiaE